MGWTWKAAGVVAVLLLLVGACSSDNESGATTTTAEDSQDLSVSTPAGQVSLSLDGSLPPEWPEDFPTPDSTDVAGSGSLAGDDSGVMVGVYTTEEARQDAFDFCANDDSLDPTDPSGATVGSGFLGSINIGGDHDGSVTVAGIDDTNYVVVVLDIQCAGSRSSTSSSTSAG